MHEKLKATILEFEKSTKKTNLLQLVAKKNIHIEAINRKPTLDLSRTRWSARYPALNRFYDSFVYIVKTFEIIGYGLATDEFDPNNEIDTDILIFDEWDHKAKSVCKSLLNSITDFQFIVTFFINKQYLSHLASPTILLQGRAMDVINAYKTIEDVKKVYKKERADIDEHFPQIFTQAERMATSVGSSVTVPRTSIRQFFRANAPSDSPLEYYKRNVAIPLLDHIINELDTQFSLLAKISCDILYLVPSILCSNDVHLDEVKIKLDRVVKLYSNDMPSPDILDREIIMWKTLYADKEESKRPSTALLALKECSYNLTPNIFTLLKIVCTLPVTSNECERCGSALRRLHEYCRARMTEERLSALAHLYIHRETEIDIDACIEVFANEKNRRLDL